MNEKTDDELIRQFQKGDISAFECFIHRHQDRLIRLAMANLYCTEYREDVVQEVFIRAYSGMPRFRFHSKPFTWLYRTLQNVCHEYNRKEQQRSALLTDKQQNETDEMQTHDNRQQIEIVFKQLASLTKREREVVLLRIFEELSVLETAQILGIRQGTVKTLLHRGLGKLREISEDMIEG